MEANSIILLIHAIIAFGVLLTAGYAIRQTRKIAREKHTLDFINEYNNNKKVNEANKFIRDIKNKSQEKQIEEYKTEENRTNFLFLMNEFEILAIGLKHGIYDKKMIDKMFGHDIYKTYNHSQTIIKHIRATDESPADSKDIAFIEFETLASEYNTESLKRNRG